MKHRFSLGLCVRAGHCSRSPGRLRCHRTMGEGCWLHSRPGGWEPGWHTCKRRRRKRQPGKPCSTESLAFQLAPVLRKGTYRLAEPGCSCFLQSCLYLLAAALPEPRQTLPRQSFEPINAAGSKARAPRGKFQPSTAALFAHATHSGGARGGVYSQNIT